MDDPVTMFDILMVSSFSFVLWYAEKRYRIAKERTLVPPKQKEKTPGRKFYWICVGNGDRAELKIWTKQDST